QIPVMPVGMHSFRHSTSDIFGTCWKGLQGKNSLFNLPFTHKQELFEWYNQGIRTLDELDENMIGKAHTRRVRNALVRNEAFTDQESVSGFIKKLKSPYAAMDMEVWNPAIPQIRHSRPFEQIPFLAGFYAPGQEANVFMAYGQDERREFAIAFIEACKQYSSLLVYDKTMEIGILKALGLRFPELSFELEEIQHKILDLFDLILHHHYYHPGFGSNLSLKSVSSVLLPAHAYGRIQSGLEAMAVYEDFRRDENPIQQQIARDELIEYCMNDCKAVYELVEFFKSL
ncbi:MAG TPA: DUF2779 domain-containing protein, partial [Bacteroidia bacterium]|nr:DUF2779 domain-containing protein [Bacteroidia bacterium]